MLVVAGAETQADVGPPEPARTACMGASDGATCTLDGKPGTCHGPHPSRMYCQTDKPPSDGSAAGAGSTTHATNNTGAGASGSGSATAADPSASAPSPGHKRGCAVSDAGSASLIGLAIVALGLRRRRRARPALPAR